MKNKKDKIQKKVDPIIKEWREHDRINSDILGSYTGTADYWDVMPEQDPDDL